MRTRTPAELFQRPTWPPALKEAGIKLRLLNRLAWPEGLTLAEREALARIAAGEELPGIPLSPQTAKAALEYPWLEAEP